MTNFKHNVGSINRREGGDHTNPNLLINGCMRIRQRGSSITAATAFTNGNDKYTLDRWNLVSDGDDIADVIQFSLAETPTGSSSGMKLLVATADKKLGICQFLEERESSFIKDSNVSLSFKAKSSVDGTPLADVENIRAAVLSWVGAADSVTSDVVNAWSIEGTDPVLATSWAYESTPTNLALADADSFTQYKLEAITITTSSINNIAVFIWIDDTDLDVGDVFFITDIKLEKGDVVTDFHPRPMAQELFLCQRYFWKTFDDGVTPAQAIGDNDGAIVASSKGTGADDSGAWVRYPNQMRTASGGAVFYSPASSAAEWRNVTAGTDEAVTDGLSSETSTRVGVGGATADTDQLYVHMTVEDEL